MFLATRTWPPDSSHPCILPDADYPASIYCLLAQFPQGPGPEVLDLPPTHQPTSFFSSLTAYSCFFPVFLKSLLGLLLSLHTSCLHLVFPVPTWLSSNHASQVASPSTKQPQSKSSAAHPLVSSLPSPPGALDAGRAPGARILPDFLLPTGRSCSAHLLVLPHLSYLLPGMF